LAATLLVLGAAAVASAQDAALVEAAKKEGKIVWYTSLVLPSAEKVAKLFEAAYPGIRVDVNRTGSQRILQKVLQEMQAGIKNADVVHTSDAGHFVLLKDKKLLLRYLPQGIDKFAAGFKDKAGYYFGLRATVNVITYYTRAVTSGDAPKSWSRRRACRSSARRRPSWPPRLTRTRRGSSPTSPSPGRSSRSRLTARASTPANPR